MRTKVNKGKIWTVYSLMLFALFFGSTVEAAIIDSDSDGLSDEEEQLWHTDPNNPDTDGDGYLDGVEIKNGYSPHESGAVRLHQSDYDGDKLSDAVERVFGTDIGKSDTDGDGYTDFDEVMYGYDPFSTEPTTKWKKKIVINLAKQRLFVVVNDIEIVQFPVSTGNPNTPTPSGDFSIQRKVDVMPYRGDDYYYPGVKWNMQFKPRYYMHTAYWHNDFGKRTRSHGCVNMREADAAVLYRYMDIGTPVEIIEKTPPKMYVVAM